MSSRRIVIPFPRRHPLRARLRASFTEILAEVVTFERTHARLAWGVTLVGVVVGLALQSL